MALVSLSVLSLLGVCSGQASLYAYCFDFCVVSTGGSLCLIAGRPGRFTRLADFCVFLA